MDTSSPEPEAAEACWVQHPQSKYAQTCGPYWLTAYKVQGTWIYVLWKNGEKVGQGTAEEMKRKASEADFPPLPKETEPDLSVSKMRGSV